MKRMVSLFLALALLACLVGCSSAATESASSGIDLAYYARVGKIPECSLVLHSDVKQAEEEFAARSQDNAHTEIEEDVYYNRVEGEKSVLLEVGNANYYYLKAEEEKGILYIVSLTGGFGLEAGTVSIEVEKALSEFEGKKEPADEDAPYAFGLGSDSHILRYEFDGIIVIFAFSDNALASVSMIDGENWTLQ